ncbi:MAG: alpha/beta fold hydrolase [Oligoflexia bacterium]|nr:alpha/beta fold hydrolase [Oligoflexia bacterium]
MEITQLNTKDTPELLILIHGGPGFSGHYFHGFFDESPYTTITYDQGFLNKPTIDSFVEELNMVTEKYKNKKIILLGHSFGSVIALEYLKKFNENITRVILSNFIYDSDFLKLELNNEWEEGFAKTNDFLQKYGATDDFFKHLAIEVSPLYFSKERRELGPKIFNKLKYSFNTYNEINNSYLSNFDLNDIINQNKDKLQFIISKNETRIPFKYFEKLLDKGVSTNIIDTESHFYFIENPKAYCDLL